VTGVQTCALPISPKPQNPKNEYLKQKLEFIYKLLIYLAKWKVMIYHTYLN
jgi:hypothetical protein